MMQYNREHTYRVVHMAKRNSYFIVNMSSSSTRWSTLQLMNRASLQVQMSVTKFASKLVPCERAGERMTFSSLMAF